MDMISETPTWFLALSEMSEVLCTETPQMWKLWFFPCCVLERSHVDVNGALSTTDVIDLQLVSESYHKLETGVLTK